MYKIRMIVFQSDGEMLGHRDFTVQQIPSGDVIEGALSALMLHSAFKPLLELILNHRVRLRTQLERLIQAIETLQDAYVGRRATGEEVLHQGFMRLSVARAKAVVAEHSFIDAKNITGLDDPSATQFEPMVTFNAGFAEEPTLQVPLITMRP